MSDSKIQAEGDLSIATGTDNSTEPVAGARGRFQWLSCLDAISLFYVLLPTLIFILGYLKPIFAWPFAMLLVVSGVLAWREAHKSLPLESDSKFSWHSGRMAVIVTLTFLLLACTGIGAFTFQFFDYKGYDPLLKDLIQRPWPLAYKDVGPENTTAALVMYSAYWLPAALVGRMLDWTGAYYFNYLWACLGMVLVLIWFMRIVGRMRVSLVLLLFFFGGLDIVGRFFTEGGPGAAQVSWYDFFTGAYWWSESRGWLDHWASGFLLTDPEYKGPAGGVFFRFYSPLSFMVDGPYHIVPGALIFLMMLHDLWRRGSTGRLLLLWANFPLGSIFFAVGALPYLALGVWEHRARQFFSHANLAALPALATIVLYFASVTSDGRMSGWIWEYQDLSKTWWILLLHYIAEFGLLLLCIPMLRLQGKLPHIFWWLGTLCFFLLAPWYRIGVYNDFASKIILAAQFVFILWIAIGIVNAETRSQQWRKWATIALLCVGTIAPLGTVARALDFGLTGTPPPKDRVRQLNEVEPRWFILQGKGNLEQPFWKYLAKDPVYRNTPPNYSMLRWDFVNPQEPIEYWIFYVEPDAYALTPKGLAINTQGNRPILRRDSMALDTRKVGMIKIEADVRVDGQPATDVAIVAQWATTEQVAAAEGDWPFQQWQTNQAYPVLNIASSNSYWRGEIAAMAFYLRVPQGDERTYEVIIREIDFLQR